MINTRSGRALVRFGTKIEKNTLFGRGLVKIGENRENTLCGKALVRFRAKEREKTPFLVGLWLGLGQK